MLYRVMCYVEASAYIEREVEAESEAQAKIAAENEIEFDLETGELDIDFVTARNIEMLESPEPPELTETEIALEERKKALPAGQMDMFAGMEVR